MHHFRFPIALAAALLACAGLAWAAPRSLPQKERASGQVVLDQPPTADNPVGRQELVATGTGTHVGRYSQVAAHDYYADGTLEGTFSTTAADGSTLSGTYDGTFSDLGNGLVRFDVNVQWLAGTGRLEGVTGTASVVAFLDATTGQFTYETDGFLTFP
jgi:hypothetical protein